MKQFIKSILILGTIIALTGCGPTWDTSNANDGSSTTVAANTPASEIRLFSGDYPHRKYEVVKNNLRVSVNKTTIFNASPTAQMVKEKMQQEAAKLGADAILFAKISSVRVGMASWGVREGSGKAVRFVD